MSAFQPLQGNLDRQIASNRLQLQEMQIGDEGAKFLADYLKRKGSNIEILDLRGNAISPVGFCPLFNALRECHNLKYLNCEWNSITKDNNLQALDALYQMLIIQKNLRHLDLRNNKL